MTNIFYSEVECKEKCIYLMNTCVPRSEKHNDLTASYYACVTQDFNWLWILIAMLVAMIITISLYILLNYLRKRFSTFQPESVEASKKPQLKDFLAEDELRTQAQ